MEGDVTRNIEEQLSAFLDGELPEAELQLLVRRLEKEPAYRATLARYSFIGSVLRDDPALPMANEFREQLLEAVTEDEPAAANVPERRWPGVSAIAAVFVGMAVLGVYQFLPQSSSEISSPVQSAAISERSAERAAPMRPVAAVTRRPLNRDRITSYLVSHGEFSRSLHGTMVDSRIFVQPARFEE